MQTHTVLHNTTLVILVLISNRMLSLTLTKVLGMGENLRCNCVTFPYNTISILKQTSSLDVLKL